MGKHRTPEQIAAALEEKLNQVRLKAARQALSDHPEISLINEEIEEIQNSIITARRWAKEAPEKVANFLEKASVWKQRGIDAEDQIAEAKAKIDDLRSQRDAKINELSNDAANS